MAARENERQVMFWMDKDLHKELRVKAAIEDLSVKQLICKVIEKYLEEEKNKNN